MADSSFNPSDSKGKITGKRSRESKPALQNAVFEHGKLQPQAVDLEEAVLGAIMLEKDALTTVIDILKPDVFYKDAHQVIYEAIYNLFGKSEPVDILTVTNELKSIKYVKEESLLYVCALVAISFGIIPFVMFIVLTNL